jgi:hypothetical protein
LKLILEDKKEIEITQEELDDIKKFTDKINSIPTLQAMPHGDTKEIFVLKKYDNGWDKKWLLYHVHTDGKKINRIAQNNVRIACEHDESTNFWNNIYKRHAWN